jgi:Apea-like HEPN
MTMTDRPTGGESSSKHNALSDKLSAILKVARTKQTTTVESDLLDRLGEDGSPMSARTNAELRQLAVPLVELLQADCRFLGRQVKLLRGEAGGVSFYPQSVGVPLLTKLFECGDPSEAIAWLRRVLGISEAFGYSITALWGVPVTKGVKITPEVELIQLTDVPDSPQKRWLLESPVHGFKTPIYSALNLSPPESALITRKKVEPVVFDPETQLDAKGFLVTQKFLKEIALALTAVGPRASIAAAHWFTFEDVDLQFANVLIGSRSRSFVEILPMFTREFVPLDPLEGAEIVRGYLALTGRAQNVVRVCLQRLNQSQRRHDVGDQAVELCTALEALLGDNNKTEMTHKIKSRAARMIGGTKIERKRIASIVGAAYSIRSSLVHTGQVNPEQVTNIVGEQMRPDEIVERAVSICADLVKLVIRGGGLPDWVEFDIS